MSNVEDRFQRISNMIEMIKRRPRRGCKYFNFDNSSEDEVIKFIVDGKKIRLLPTKHSHMYSKDEFHIHFNLSEKKIMHYSYCINNYFSGEPSNEEQGYFEWDEVEESLHTFLALNIRELTDVMTPHTNADDKQNYKPSTPQTYTPPYKPKEETGPHNYPHYANQSNNITGWGSEAYKHREAFFDKLWDLLKINQTATAIDHINSFFIKKNSDKKFEEIDAALRSVVFDKLNIPSMLGILRATQSIPLKERVDFFNKVKNHLLKIKPSRANILVDNLEASTHLNRELN